MWRTCLVANYTTIDRTEEPLELRKIRGRFSTSRLLTQTISHGRIGSMHSPPCFCLFMKAQPWSSGKNISLFSDFLAWLNSVICET